MKSLREQGREFIEELELILDEWWVMPLLILSLSVLMIKYGVISTGDTDLSHWKISEDTYIGIVASIVVAFLIYKRETYARSAKISVDMKYDGVGGCALWIRNESWINSVKDVNVNVLTTTAGVHPVSGFGICTSFNDDHPFIRSHVNSDYYSLLSPIPVIARSDRQGTPSGVVYDFVHSAGFGAAIVRVEAGGSNCPTVCAEFRIELSPASDTVPILVKSVTRLS